jgi:hypothetical protein
VNAVRSTTVYEKRVARLISADERYSMEAHIADHPEIHPVVAGTGGVRKARWSREGKGKSGGVRTIYFYASSFAVVLMIDIYSKNEKGNLTDADKKAIRSLVKEYQKSLR